VAANTAAWFLQVMQSCWLLTAAVYHDVKKIPPVYVFTALIRPVQARASNCWKNNPVPFPTRKS